MELKLEVHFMDGDSLRFAIERTESEARNFGARVERAMNSPYIGVEIDDELMLVPTQNIKSVRISPVPEQQVAVVVKGAKRIE
jgi:hypothetical protein